MTPWLPFLLTVVMSGAGDSVGGQGGVSAQIQWEVSLHLHDGLPAHPGAAVSHQLQQEVPHLLQAQCECDVWPHHAGIARHQLSHGVSNNPPPLSNDINWHAKTFESSNGASPVSHLFILCQILIYVNEWSVYGQTSECRDSLLTKLLSV